MKNFFILSLLLALSPGIVAMDLDQKVVLPSLEQLRVGLGDKVPPYLQPVRFKVSTKDTVAEVITKVDKFLEASAKDHPDCAGRILLYRADVLGIFLEKHPDILKHLSDNDLLDHHPSH